MARDGGRKLMIALFLQTLVIQFYGFACVYMGYRLGRHWEVES